MSATLADVFRCYPSLGSLSDALRERMGREASAFHMAAGTLMFDIGQSCQHVPLVTRGAIRVLRPLVNGRDVPLFTVGPGGLCVLSIAGAFAPVPCAARAIVMEEVDGFLLPIPLFLALVDGHAPFRGAVLGYMSVRLVALASLIEDTAVTTVDRRLAELLVARGPVVHATHQRLADELGTAREVISRILEHFEAEGLVTLKRSEVRVTAPGRLAHPGAATSDEPA